jgi:hypothetical protein
VRTIIKEINEISASISDAIGKFNHLSPYLFKNTKHEGFLNLQIEKLKEINNMLVERFIPMHPCDYCNQPVDESCKGCNMQVSTKFHVDGVAVMCRNCKHNCKHQYDPDAYEDVMECFTPVNE